MASNPTRPEYASGLDGDEPGRGVLVSLSGRRATAAPSRRAGQRQHGASGKLYRIGEQFTLTDHATLAAWASETGHGYGRVDVDQGLLEDGSWAGYALVYGPGQAWSRWGVRRRGDHLEVWRCATGKTVGRHARMATALASLPHATDHGRAPRAVVADEAADRRCPVGCGAPC